MSFIDSLKTLFGSSSNQADQNTSAPVTEMPQEQPQEVTQPMGEVEENVISQEQAPVSDENENLPASE